MSSVELQRDLQEIDDLTGAIVRGTSDRVDVLSQRLELVCQKQSAWQWCIHGDTLAYRRMVTKWLVKKDKFVLAKRFALCGKGDMIAKHESSGMVRVRPMGCGASFCPRCSSRSGRKHLSRIVSHLSTSGHGSIYHVVLTHPAAKEETLGSARARFEKSWKLFYPTLRKCGLRSALATYHAKPSPRWGWHYHCHLVVEFDDGIDSDTLYSRLNERWQIVSTPNDVTLQKPKDLFMRLVVKPGPALVGMKENTQLDFWDEPTDQVEAALHYVIRDVLQGVSGWIEGLTSDAGVFEFCEMMAAAKRHRSYGAWRKKVPDDDTEAKDEAEDRAVSAAGSEGPKVRKLSEWILGETVDKTIHSSKHGSAQCISVLMLLIGHTNRSQGVLFRLRKLVTWLAV